MKVRVTFELDSIAEAEEVMQAVKLLKDKPYRLKGFGAPIVNHEVDNELELEELRPGNVIVVKEEVRKNINPGEPSIGKIGEATKILLLDDLAEGKQPPLPKYAEHLKLLWKRGLVKYDGKEYYL